MCTNITILLSLQATQKEFMYGVVQGTFNVITAEGSYLEPFFNGSIPSGSPDYTNSTAGNDLIDGWVSYFAAAEPFGCNAIDIPAYDNPESLKDIHKDIPIDESAFNTFNTAMLGVLQGMGVSDEDRAAVLDFLDGKKSDVCTDCSFAAMLKPLMVLSVIAMALVL